MSNNHVAFIRSIAELLRGSFKAHQKSRLEAEHAATAR